MTDKMKNLIVRAISGALFVVIMVGGFMSPRTMVALFALITGLTVWEFTGLVNQRKGVTVNRFISTVAGVYFFLAVAAIRMGITSNFIIIVPYLLTIVYLFISELYLKQEDPVNDWAYTMLSQLYIALPFSMINVLGFELSEDGVSCHYNMLLPLCVFIFLWLNDTGAYCSGSLFGKHKLFPRISGWVGLGLIVVVFGTWGDLVESLFKRTLGIKDSGKIMPGHGGMLDRFDSSLMAIPASVVYLYTLQLLS